MVASSTQADFEKQLAEITSKQQAIVDAADKDSGGKLSKEQREEYDKLDAEYVAVELSKKEFVADQQRKERLAQRPKPTVPSSENLTGDRIKVNEDPKKAGFKSHHDFLSAVREAANGHLDQRLNNLRPKKLAVGSDEQSTFNDPYGGFLIPEAYAPGLMSLGVEDDPVAGRVMQLPMGSPTVKVLARVDKNHTSSVSGGLRVYRREESGPGTSSRMQVEKISLEATSLFGLAYATEELIADSPQSFVALLEAGFRDEFQNELLNERMNGTGVGEFEGALNSACLVTVAKESGQAADTITFDNVVKMRARSWGYGNAIWMANQDCLPQLAKLNDGTNHIWQPSAREDVPDLLMGRPLFFTEYCKTVGDLGDIMCINWSQFLEGTYQPMNSASSIHCRFETHEQTFKFWMRNAGRWWWRSALTPKNSSNTLSPVVALAARA